MSTKVKTLVLGASPKPQRFSYKAVKSLNRHHHEVLALGFREGHIDEHPILCGKPELDDIHTVSLYLGEARQAEYEDYIISLRPRRVIFNPGTNNPAFMGRLNNEGIEVVDECMLVMLTRGTF